jgi:hypothetical protein
VDLDNDIANVLPADAKPARVAEAKRHAENVISRGERTVDALLGSVETTRGLGAGGFTRAREVREWQKEMALIARDLGKTPAEVLLRGDRRDEKVRRFLERHARVQTGLGDLSRRLAETGKHGTMDTKEEEAYTRYRAEEVKDDDRRNLEAVERALGTDVTAGLATTEQRQEIAQLFGAGIEGEYRRHVLAQALGARGKLLSLMRPAAEGGRGLDLVGLRREIDRPTGILTAAEQAAATSNLSRAGALAEGIGPENLRQFLESFGKPPGAPGEPGDPGRTQEIKLYGRLDIVSGDMNATGEAVTPDGATPAVP